MQHDTGDRLRWKFNALRGVTRCREGLVDGERMLGCVTHYGPSNIWTTIDARLVRAGWNGWPRVPKGLQRGLGMRVLLFILCNAQIKVNKCSRWSRAVVKLERLFIFDIFFLLVYMP